MFNVYLAQVLRAFILLGLLTSAAASDHSTRRAFSFDDMKAFNVVGSMELSPDGEMLAYTVGYDRPRLWLVATRRDSVPRDFGDGMYPHWSPSGELLAYYARAHGHLQLWVMNVKSGHAKPVTHLEGGVDPNFYTGFVGMNGWTGDPFRYDWSPDSTSIVFASQRLAIAGRAQRISIPKSKEQGRANRGHGVPLILTTTTPPQWTLAGLFAVGGFGRTSHAAETQRDLSANLPVPPTANHLFIVDIRSGAVKRLTRDDSQYFTPVWSPDGTKILCVSAEGRPLVGWGSGPTNLYMFDVHTGEGRAVTADNTYKRIPTWSLDGKSIAFLGANGDNLGAEYLYVMPAKGGMSINVTAKLDRHLVEAHWLPDQSLAINYEDGVDVPVSRLDVQTGEATIISGSTKGYRFVMTASRSGSISWEQDDASGPSFIYQVKAVGKEPSKLLDLNPEVSSRRLGVQEVVNWKNGHGVDMGGVLIKPVNYQEGHKYPVIVDAYPQMGDGFFGEPMTPGQAWANKGYAVFYPNADAPHVWQNSWRSNSRNTRAKGIKGVDVVVDDVMSGVDHLIAEGIADPDRMCIYGFSNGGGVVNQIVTKTNRFKCAVSIGAALSEDWSTPFFLQTHAKGIADIVGATPWEDPDAYFKLSSLYRMDKVMTPMLLADGDHDGLFLLGEIEVYNALRYLGKEVVFLRYPDQEHGFKGAAMKDFWERENAFFEKYLNPEQPPD